MYNKFGHHGSHAPPGADSSTVADFVVRFSTAESSSLHDNGTVQYSIVGIMGFDGVAGEAAEVAFDNGIAAEGTNDAEVYTSPGMVGRPLPPRSIDGRIEHMDVICVQTVEGLVPIAYRDVRLQMAGDAAPGEGVLAFVGYGGGFFSQTPVEIGVDPAGGGTIQVMYCPYDFDENGVAQKAHTMIMDPTEGNQSIMLVHGNGLALTMSDEGDRAILMKNVAGDATFRLDDEGCTITAANIVLSGGVIIGEPLLATPMLAGIATLPSTKLSYSP
jgi:hypothetical protein